MAIWMDEDYPAAVDVLKDSSSVTEAAQKMGLASAGALRDKFNRQRRKVGFEWLKTPNEYLRRTGPASGTSCQQSATSEGVVSRDTDRIPERRDAVPPPKFERRCGDEFPSRAVAFPSTDSFVKPTDPAFNGTGSTGLASSRCWLVLPDLHGRLMDRPAAEAALDIVSELQPDGIVQLGDILDLSGIWTSHTPSYVKETEYRLFGPDGDVECARWFLDEAQRRAPKAWWKVTQGNHDLRLEVKLSRMSLPPGDARALERMLAPDVLLDFKGRGIQFARMDEFYDGLSLPGAFKIGQCHVVHGISAARHADAVHLAKFGASVIFGHVHRAMSMWERTVARGMIFSGSPGTLSILQPLYMHTSVTAWSHGVIACFEDGDQFLPILVPIVNGKHMLREMLGRVRPSALVGRAA